MKSLTYPRRLLLALSAKTAVFTGLVAALAALSAIGCTSRKQYEINEAILISERRQLEDEIYRTKFELRDALKENERLQQQLEKNGGSGDAKKTNSARRPSANTDMYPGGSQLQVGGSETAPAYQNMVDPDRYDDSAPRGTLPDFAPMPTQNNFSQTGARAKNTVAKTTGTARSTVAANAAKSGKTEKNFGVSRPVALDTPGASSNRVASSNYEAPRSTANKVSQTSYESSAETAASDNASGSDVSGFESPSDEEDWSPVGAN